MTNLWQKRAFRAILAPSVVLGLTIFAVVHLGIAYRRSGQPEAMYADDLRSIRMLWVTAGVGLSIVCALLFGALTLARRLTRLAFVAAATLFIIAAPGAGSIVLATASDLAYQHTGPFFTCVLAPVPLQWCALLAPTVSALLGLSRRETTGGRA